MQSRGASLEHEFLAGCQTVPVSVSNLGVQVLFYSLGALAAKL